MKITPGQRRRVLESVLRQFNEFTQGPDGSPWKFHDWLYQQTLTPAQRKAREKRGGRKR